MRSVTRRAVRRDNKPFSEQTFSVNALGVVLKDPTLRDFPFLLDPRALLMAAPADKRDFQRSNRRRRVFHRFDIVVAVARLTVGCQRVITGYCFSVKTFGMELLFGIMTRPAVNLLKGRFVR